MSEEHKAIQKGQEQEVEVGGEKPNEKTTIVKRSLYIGPVPDPKTVDEYNKVSPGLGDRLVEAFFKEQDERHHNNRTFFKTFTRGQYLGFVLGLVGTLGAIYLLSQGIEWGGGFGIMFLGLLPTVISRITQYLTKKFDLPPKDSDNEESPE